VAVSGRTLGLVLAVLTSIGLLLVVIGLAALAGASGQVPVLSVGSGTTSAALVLDVVADILLLVGGWRMSQGDRLGRGPATLGLLVALVSAVVAGGAGIAAEVVVLLVIYALVAVSRFPEPTPPPAGPG